MKRLRDHVIVCCFSDGVKSPQLGLCNFVMPLRASNLHLSQLRTVVILADEEFLHKEWPTLCNFPDVYVKTVRTVRRLRFQIQTQYKLLSVLTFKKNFIGSFAI